MSRVVMEINEQLEYFSNLKSVSGLSSEELGKLVGISGRSFRDWVSGKTLPTLEGVGIFKEKFGIDVSNKSALREEHWAGRFYGRKAGLCALTKYGPPGTRRGRIKGGIISQRRRKENPEYYRSLGCKVANTFAFPCKSNQLAEFIGIILGDGGITRSQCQITLHQFDDKPYSFYIKELIKDLFGYQASLLVFSYKTARVLIISGVNFVRNLLALGLKVGNKVKNQISIPAWIKEKDSWYTACIRGLFDTDGGTFTHKHKVCGKTYTHFGIVFTNASKNILDDFANFLREHDIKYGLSGLNIMVYNRAGIKRFFNLVSPHNKKHIGRYNQYIGE